MIWIPGTAVQAVTVTVATSNTAVAADGFGVFITIVNVDVCQGLCQGFHIGWVHNYVTPDLIDMLSAQSPN
tara:strand:+ start:396 stop:608 length:213 start_codon:yes stop_codon:yes gene_type:complete